MAATSRPPAPSRPRARDAWAHVVAPIVVLVVGLVVSALAQHAADSASRAHSLADFLEVARDHEAQITRRLRDDEQIVLGAAGLFQVLPAVGRDDFRRYVAALRVRESYPGIQAVAFVRAVPGGERAAFVDEVRRADDPGFHLWPERAGEDAATLLYVEPGDDQNTRAIGFDLRSDPLRGGALSAARDSGEAALAAPVVLATSAPGNTGHALLAVPVYRRGVSIATVDARRAAHLGFVTCAIRVGALVERVLAERSDGFVFDIRAASAGGAPATLYASAPLDGPGVWSGGLATDVDLDVLGSRWTFRFRAPADFGVPARPLRGRSSIVFGALGSVGLAIVVLALGAERRRRGALLRARRESEELFAVAFENAPIMMTLSRPGDGTYLAVNDCFVATSGYSRDETVGARSIDLGWITAEDRARLAAELRARGRVDDLVLDLRCKDGTVVTASFAGVLVTVRGEPCLLSIARDLTVERALQRDLEQAQKLESIGRLAGGVAHDFNNMLAVIRGYADMLLGRDDLPADANEDLAQIRDAADRSAQVTQKLLGFARKQVVAPRVLDLDETVDGMLKMLRRLIGEDVELAFTPARDLLPVKVDPSQIDQVLTNLCVNARDAIVGVGRITIATRNVELDDAAAARHAGLAPGRYVELSVRDDGSGIPADVMPHVFEPFYTTKEVGRGSGLGLATVYGIARQNGGAVEAESPGGAGTTFRVFLPASDGERRSAPIHAAKAPESRGRGELVLVVEDEPAVLRLCTRVIGRLGYEVAAASRPEDALAIAAARGDAIRLVVSDVVMPDMSGVDLVARLRATRPALRCLFMSGYTPHTIAKHGVAGHVTLLQKPFDDGELAAKIREALA